MTGLKRLFALLIPLACAALFVRLGFWQLERGQDRAVINDELAARLVGDPIPFDQLPTDTARQRWQRVTLSGRYRYDLEQVEAGRTNAGSPGVHLLTPLERDSGELVVVTRGWVYSPDAASVQRERWREREGETVAIAGYVLPLADTASAPSSGPLRVVDRTALEARIGEPIAAVRVVMTSDSLARADSVPRRLALPAIDPGPHRGYAIQWFAFALIAVVGGALLFRAAGGPSAQLSRGPSRGTY